MLVGDAVESSGDGGVAVCARRLGKAQERAVNKRLETGDPGGVQACGRSPNSALPRIL